MSTPDPSGRSGRASRPPTPVASTKQVHCPTSSHTQQEHTTSDQIRRPFIPHRLTEQMTLGHAPPTPAPTLLPSTNGITYSPSVLGKRAADPPSEVLTPAAKKQAKTTMASEDALDAISACRACGSLRHGTEDCHVPCSDGTVVICPFHGCTVLNKTGPPGHPLDGFARFRAGDRSKAPLYCEVVMSYEMTVRAKNKVSVRRMLPLLFGEFVVKRRRKPCCRVVNKEVCPINLAIEYSQEFCQGKIPPHLQGMWPYTMRDATDPAIIAKLEQYDELGLEGMPPDELEAKSWEQIKREYANGTIPPQLHVVKPKQRPTDLATTTKTTAAELGGSDADQRTPDTEQQTVNGSRARENARVGEDTVQSLSQDLKKMDVLLEEMQRLSAKLDSLVERFDAMESRQTGGSYPIAPASSAVPAHPELTNIEMVTSLVIGMKRW